MLIVIWGCIKIIAVTACISLVAGAIVEIIDRIKEHKENEE